jgi:hypothetical protein
MERKPEASRTVWRYGLLLGAIAVLHNDAAGLFDEAYHQRRSRMNFHTPLQVAKIILGVAIGVAGGTLIADSAAGRLGVWSVPLALLVVGVSIAMYGMLEPFKKQRRAKILRGMIALVFLADVVCLVGSHLGADVAGAVAFWRRGSLLAHVLVIMLVAFGVDPFLRQKRR